MTASDLQKGQLAIRKLMSSLTSDTDDEVVRLVVEHALVHPFDTFCDYPLKSEDFPELTLEHISALANSGFTVDVGVTSVRIYWVLDPDN